MNLFCVVQSLSEADKKEIEKHILVRAYEQISQLRNETHEMVNSQANLIAQLRDDLYAARQQFPKMLQEYASKIEAQNAKNNVTKTRRKK